MLTLNEALITVVTVSMNDQVLFNFNISLVERRLLCHIILNDNKEVIPLWKFPLRNSKQVKTH